MTDIPNSEPLLVVADCQALFDRFQAKYPQATLRTPHLKQFNESQGTHLQPVASKRDFNVQLLIDFFLLMYAENCVWDGESFFSKMACFIRGGSYADILGYDA